MPRFCRQTADAGRPLYFSLASRMRMGQRAGQDLLRYYKTADKRSIASSRGKSATTASTEGV
jgi:hypothetical protein